MGVTRTPFQGVSNIIRFNWHFYVLSLVVVVGTIAVGWYWIGVLAFAGTMTSLLVSYYIYDVSALYTLNWIVKEGDPKVILNIHAGFDETSVLLGQRFEEAELGIIDFYDPEKHTEVSIKRARKRYPGLPQTVRAAAVSLPVGDGVVDRVFVIFSAHEIRDEGERLAFLKELARIVRPGGQICITEHLRDVANFMAFNIGFFHFYSRGSWLRLFAAAGLRVVEEKKLTPFISAFIISKNGDSY